MTYCCNGAILNCYVEIELNFTHTQREETDVTQ